MPYSGRGQAGAVSVGKGVVHIIQQGEQTVVEIRDGTALPGQNVVAHLHDVADSHKKGPPYT